MYLRVQWGEYNTSKVVTNNTHNSLFEPPIDLYNTQYSKILEKSEKVSKIWDIFLKLGKNFGEKLGKKVDFNKGGGCAIYTYNTQDSLIRVRQ